MQNNDQSKFILTPVTNILQDTVNACNGIGQGIETQSLGEYVLQTTFLKMTGASEQKLKCICWEMATRDYAYRYQYLKKNYGECSSYADKNSIYKDLVDRILAIDSDFSVDCIFEDVDISEKVDKLIEQKFIEAQKKQEANKKRVLNADEIKRLEEGIRMHINQNGISDKDKVCFTRAVLFENVQDRLTDILGRSLVELWEQHDYRNYLGLWKVLSCYSFAQRDMLLCKELHELYMDIVYIHRNRCAHNLLSYQNNLSTLNTLINENFVYDNYYFRFSMLILLDEIFVRLYKAYMELIKKRY